MSSKHMDCLSNDMICNVFGVTHLSEKWMKAMNLLLQKNAHGDQKITKKTQQVLVYTVLRGFVCSWSLLCVSEGPLSPFSRRADSPPEERK